MDIERHQWEAAQVDELPPSSNSWHPVLLSQTEEVNDATAVFGSDDLGIASVIDFQYFTGSSDFLNELVVEPSSWLSDVDIAMTDEVNEDIFPFHEHPLPLDFTAPANQDIILHEPFVDASTFQGNGFSWPWMTETFGRASHNTVDDPLFGEPFVERSLISTDPNTGYLSASNRNDYDFHLSVCHR